MNNKTIDAKVFIHNLPQEIIHGFMVVRNDEGDLWYYGTYAKKDKAQETAAVLGNGLVLEV